MCVVTFDEWYLAILFDWVQGIMLVSQGKVLSPGNEGSMAVIVYDSIFLQLCFICVHMPISGLSFWVQFLYMPATLRQIGVLNGSPQCGLDCESGYCYICGIWYLFRVEGGLYFLYFWILDPGL